MRRRRSIIKNKKLRGEWTELLFMAAAYEYDLPVCKPWGDARSFDVVVGRPGRFLAVQVKSTICELCGGYACTLRGCRSQKYTPGSFDFLAAYVILEDAWYIVPAELIAGKERISLASESERAHYEAYREAWHLLRRSKQVKIDHLEAFADDGYAIEADAENSCADDACEEDVRGEYDWAQKFRPVMLPPRSVLPHLARMFGELVRLRCGQLLYGV
jgi:hypothetical protein